MKTDSLFYEIFQTDPSIIFELINSKSPRIATYSFASVEVKETSFRMDGILVPPIYATDLPIVFVEVQGYRDTKKVLYSSFISEIFLYLHDYQPVNDWEGVLIFTKRSLDPGLPRNYRIFGSSEQFHRIYLDELDESTGLSLGLSLLQLVGLKEEIAKTRGKELITRTRQEVTDTKTQRKFIELIETVFVYKFPDLMREEIEAMLGLNELKQTRVYREALEEGLEQGKLKAVPLLLKAGMTVEEIAKQLGVDLAAVKKVAEEQQHN
ncbi:Rpn family recombination-promoting nuclease/putative transposase [Anabaena cylindrica UHCC 0172]|uniref:Rpn family recombination-promoting nuclease/putative transposase n=1 Tax=Anabaena cylindrica TaxID=1165 RepID=UPI002B1FD0AC|nr:Rpn family recombination-promoting nuclease/putative transposase [Anabaena cylindrica]MEA5550296.1 Rpn family recombination-promoting nuclease/putative transposase [Anabaena cylindrica UHCC 0172]